MLFRSDLFESRKKVEGVSLGEPAGGGGEAKVATEVRAKLMRPYNTHTSTLLISCAVESILRRVERAVTH